MLQKHPIEEMHYSSASYGISRKKSQTFEHPSNENGHMDIYANM